jgi:hypothetical protein
VYGAKLTCYVKQLFYSRLLAPFDLFFSFAVVKHDVAAESEESERAGWQAWGKGTTYSFKETYLSSAPFHTG